MNHIYFHTVNTGGFLQTLVVTAFDLPIKCKKVLNAQIEKKFRMGNEFC